jgi:hypothetical protein
VHVPVGRRGHFRDGQGPDWRRFKKSHPMLSVFDTFLGDDDYPRAVCATKINLGLPAQDESRPADHAQCRDPRLPRIHCSPSARPSNLRMFEEARKPSSSRPSDELAREVPVLPGARARASHDRGGGVSPRARELHHDPSRHGGPWIGSLVGRISPHVSRSEPKASEAHQKGVIRVKPFRGLRAFGPNPPYKRTFDVPGGFPLARWVVPR